MGGDTVVQTPPGSPSRECISNASGGWLLGLSGGHLSCQFLVPGIPDSVEASTVVDSHERADLHVDEEAAVDAAARELLAHLDK